MFVALKNQRGHAASAQIIKSATDKRKIFRRQVLDWRREIQLAVEPRLDGVLVGGYHVQDMIRHQRMDVAGNNLVRELLL